MVPFDITTWRNQRRTLMPATVAAALHDRNEPLAYRSALVEAGWVKRDGGGDGGDGGHGGGGNNGGGGHGGGDGGDKGDSKGKNDSDDNHKNNNNNNTPTAITVTNAVTTTAWRSIIVPAVAPSGFVAGSPLAGELPTTSATPTPTTVWVTTSSVSTVTVAASPSDLTPLAAQSVTGSPSSSSSSSSSSSTTTVWLTTSSVSTVTVDATPTSTMGLTNHGSDNSKDYGGNDNDSDSMSKNNDNGGSKHHQPPNNNNNSFAIAFGTLGGIGLIVGIVWAILLYRRRRRNGSRRQEQQQWRKQQEDAMSINSGRPYRASQQSLPGSIYAASIAPHDYLDEKRAQQQQGLQYPPRVMDMQQQQQGQQQMYPGNGNVRMSGGSWMSATGPGQGTWPQPGGLVRSGTVRSDGGWSGSGRDMSTVGQVTMTNLPMNMMGADVSPASTYQAQAQAQMQPPPQGQQIFQPQPQQPTPPTAYISELDTTTPRSYPQQQQQKSNAQMPYYASYWSDSSGTAPSSVVGSETATINNMAPPSELGPGTLAAQQAPSGELTSLRQELMDLYAEGERRAGS